MSEHDHWCDCGRPECWEEQLRLRVNFDKNQDREVCILFIHRLLTRAKEEGRQEADWMGENLLDARKSGFKEGRTAVIEEVEAILRDELAIAHTTKSGKTSRLTSALNRVDELRSLEK